jgi:hypothetical protein
MERHVLRIILTGGPLAAHYTAASVLLAICGGVVTSSARSKPHRTFGWNRNQRLLQIEANYLTSLFGRTAPT